MNQAGAQPLIEGARRWDFLANLMINLHLRTFVEVGCKEGRTTGHILKTVPEARVVAIDPWRVQEKSDDPKRETYQDWDFAKIEAEFWENVGEHKDRCEMIRLPGGSVAHGFKGPADLVFIDAMHDHASVAMDIPMWWPHVRRGGILAGHDFNHKWPGVGRAVAQHFNLLNVGVGPDSVWFVLKSEGVDVRSA